MVYRDKNSLMLEKKKQFHFTGKLRRTEDSRNEDLNSYQTGSIFASKGRKLNWEK